MTFDDKQLDAEILAFIEERFADNLAVLEAEGNVRMSAYIREQALKQIKMYWKRMKETALKVTETEVPLTLSNQKTPGGKTFNIYGVVDIVQEDGETVLYDIKTHDADIVRENKAEYGKQLNIYAKIWEGIKGHKLDRTAVIATNLSSHLHHYLKEHDVNDSKIDDYMKDWDPVIDMDYNSGFADETITDFAGVVDKIEDCDFKPCDPEILRKKIEGTNKTFAVNTCRNCDIRFCCDSYREYAYSRRKLSGDDILHLMKEVGETRENEHFKTISAEADLEKEYESSTAEVVDVDDDKSASETEE